MHPTGENHLDYNARTLLWVTRHTGDPRYVRAWLATHERRLRVIARTETIYATWAGGIKIPDNFPWHEAHLWGAHWDGANVTFAPMLDLLEIGREAMIELPYGGQLRVRRTEQGLSAI